MIKRLLSLMTCLIALVSCNQDNDEVNVIVEKPLFEEEQGSFHNKTTIFLNNQVVNNIKLEAEFAVEGDEFICRVKAENLPGNMLHKQYIYSGSRCPTSADDQNNDGFIDWKETQAVSGDILIPLDGSIESQEELGGYPTASFKGSYRYERRGSFSRLISDLYRDDEVKYDDFGKIPPGEPLYLEGRVMIIHGVPSTTNLPDTVSPSPQDAANVALPIGCAYIERQF